MMMMMMVMMVMMMDSNTWNGNIDIKFKTCEQLFLALKQLMLMRKIMMVIINII